MQIKMVANIVNVVKKKTELYIKMMFMLYEIYLNNNIKLIP